ncbi:hypothetical protein [Wohlfahrtiimonas populi]|uniref:hypothetical protein n=1 Tax=Wohlfahrtiimonas populi TaxID=1940240 RepID=UPI00098D3EC1|nr:hypothetical protein [Wohlfahrtiimonas populi]
MKLKTIGEDEITIGFSKDELFILRGVFAELFSDVSIEIDIQEFSIVTGITEEELKDFKKIMLKIYDELPR